MGDFYGELLIRITSDTAGLSKGLQQSAAQTSAASKSMEAAGKKAKVSWERVGLGMQNVGRTMSQFVTIPIAAGFAFAAYSGYKYSKTLLQIRNLTGLTADETTRYGDAMLNMSKYGVGPQKLAESMYFISSSGFKASEALKVLDVAAKASASGMGEVQPIADVLTSAMNAYGHSNLSAARATDILMKTIEVGKAEPEALATSLGRIMPVAAKLGVPLGQVGGAIAGLTLTGLSAAESVTSLRGTMIALAAPAKMSIEELKRLGLSYQDVTRSIKEKGLLSTMQMLYEKTDGNMLSMRKIIPNVRALNGVLSLLGPNYKKNVEITKQVIDSNGKLAESFKVTAATPLQKFRVAIATIQSEFTKAGIAIMPTLANIVSSIGKVFAAFGNLSSGTKGIIAWAAVVVAALGPIIMIAGSVIRSVALIKGALASIAVFKGIGAASAAFQVGGMTEGFLALGAALGPVTIAIGAFAVAAGTVYGLNKLTNWLDGTTARVNAMKAALDTMKDDTTGQLKAKLDRQFGGHLEEVGGKVVWKPQVDFKPPSKVNGLVEWVKRSAAEAQQAITEANKMIRIKNARGNVALFAQQAKDLRNRAQLVKAPGAQKELLDQAKQAEAMAKTQGLLLAQLTGQMSRLQAQNSKLVLFAGQQDRIKAIADQVKKVADLKAKLAKDPGNIKLGLKAEKAERDLANLKKELADYQRQHYEALLDVKIDNAKKNLAAVDKHLAWLRKQKSSPAVDAQIKAFEAKRAAIVQRMHELNAMTANPTVTANTDGALSAINNVGYALMNLRDKTVTIKVNRQGAVGSIPNTAEGGVFRNPQIRLFAEDGPEAVIPLNKPARAAQIMQQAGLAAPNTTAVAGKAAAAASRVASAVAQAIGRGIRGKKAKKVKNAADTSDAISTLVDFISSITDALERLNSVVVPSLAKGWQAKVKTIVKSATALSQLIAAEINKAFPWTKGKAKTKKRDAIDPKAGKKGTKLGQGAETSGPIGELVSFISSIAEALEAVVSVTVPDINASVKANVVKLVKAAAELATMIAAAIKEAVPTGISAAVTENASSMSSVIGDVTSMVGSLTEMTEDAVNKAISGAANMGARMPELTAALKSMLAQFAYAMRDVAVSPELAAVSSAISQFVGEITGVVTSLTDMTSKTIQDAIWGAGWLSYRAQDLAAALRQMLAQMNYAFQGFSTAGVDNLNGILTSLTGMAGNTTALLDSLGKLTGKVTGAGVVSAQQIGGSFAGAAGAGGGIGSITFNVTVEATGDISAPGVAAQAGRDFGTEAIRILASKTRANNRMRPRGRR